MSSWPEMVDAGVLVCPASDHGRLAVDPQQQSLTCSVCSRVYPVRDGIPVLLLSDAAHPSDG